MLRDFLTFSLILILTLSLSLSLIIVDFDIYYISFISNFKLKRVASKSTSLRAFFSKLLLFLLLLLRKSSITKIAYIINS